MKYEVWSERLIPKISIFLMTTRLRKSASKQAATQKNNILPSCKKKKKSNCAEKTTTYGWVGCEQKEYSYHIWTFPLQTWGEGEFSRRECEGAWEHLILKAQLRIGKAKKVLFQVSYSWEPGIEFHLWPKNMLKRMKADKSWNSWLHSVLWN